MIKNKLGIITQFNHIFIDFIFVYLFLNINTRNIKQLNLKQILVKFETLKNSKKVIYIYIYIYYLSI